MIGSKTGATRWMRSVKQVCTLGSALAAVAVSSASCSSSPLPPRAFVTAQLADYAPDPSLCAQTGPVIGIGVNETSVTTGTGGVTVTCSVTTSGSSFNVEGTVMSGTSTFTIHGTLSAADPTAEQGGITASFGANTSIYNATSCTVNLSPNASGESGATDQSNGKVLMGVAAGRVWGNVTCPMLTAVGGQQSTCSGTAEFKFEDCSE